MQFSEPLQNLISIKNKRQEMENTPANSSLSNINVASDQLKYKGVRKRKWGKYVSEIRLPNSRERIWLGSYDTAEKAARAFDAAQFCLRGRNANFNFPDDPPNIVDGQSLTPSEIQTVAQQYAITCARAIGNPNMEDISPSTNSDSIDWSFLDMLDSNGTGDNAGNITDFGLFQEPGDMYMPLHFAANQGEEYIDDNASSFLWNF